MMHDALRTDVGNAQQALRSARPAATADVLVDATDAHAQQFRSDIDGLRAIDLSPSDAEVVAALVPAQDGYIATAQRLVRSMLRTGRVDEPAIEQFQAMFDSLVTTQAAATVILADSSADLVRAQSRHERVTARVLMIGSGAALAGWALLVGMHRREGARLRDALGREAAQRTVADELQRGLFPAQLPAIPGLRLAARSTPGDSSMRVGGDWYDVILLPSGEVGLVVGDVVGHDLPAAAAMGQIRDRSSCLRRARDVARQSARARQHHGGHPGCHRPHHLPLRDREPLHRRLPLVERRPPQPTRRPGDGPGAAAARRSGTTLRGERHRAVRRPGQ